MQALRRLRQQHGWTQDTLARMAGCGRSFLSEIETGQANPTQAVLERLAQALDVPVSALFEDLPP